MSRAVGTNVSIGTFQLFSTGFDRFGQAIKDNTHAIFNAFTFSRELHKIRVPIGWHASSVDGFFWAMLTTEAAIMSGQFPDASTVSTMYSSEFLEVVQSLFPRGLEAAMLFRASAPLQTRDIETYNASLQEEVVTTDPDDEEENGITTIVDQRWIAACPNIFQLVRGENVVYFLGKGSICGANGRAIRESADERQGITEEILEDFFVRSLDGNWNTVMAQLDAILLDLQNLQTRRSLVRSHNPILTIIAMAPEQLSKLMCFTAAFGKKSPWDKRDNAELLQQTLEMNAQTAFTYVEDQQVRISPPTKHFIGSVGFPFFENEIHEQFWQRQRFRIRNVLRSLEPRIFARN